MYDILIIYAFVSFITFSLTVLPKWRSAKSLLRFNGLPSLPSAKSIPLVGHIPGLFRRRMQYFNDIGKSLREPITSVSILGTNIYVIGSADILPALQRQQKALSSHFFIAQFVPRMIGATTASLKSFSAHLTAESDEGSMLMEGVRATKRIMSSLAGTEMSRVAAGAIKRHIDEDVKRRDDSAPIDLWDWVKHTITVSNSETVYGPDSPYKDPKIESAFWKFVDDSLWLSLTSFLPSFITSRFLPGLEGRETFVKAMNDYMVAGSQTKGSPLVNAHYPLFASQLEHSEVARFEAANGLGTLANTAPTAFWTIWHTFSDPAILAEVRRQVDSITTAELSHEGKLVRKINMKRLREAPILTSAVQEASRHRATGIGVRMVMRDTTLSTPSGTHHLKANSVLIIANQAIHTDRAAWGDDANQFVAERFAREKVPQHAFRGFGNGSSACCGKNFAIVQVAAFLSMMVGRFDLSVEGEEQAWLEPGQDGRSSAAQVSPPLRSPKVVMRERKDMGACEWEFVW